ncbi:hypothetical protein ACSAZK_16295 [Methanosarcina sp. Mfa9]
MKPGKNSLAYDLQEPFRFLWIWRLSTCLKIKLWKIRISSGLRTIT